MLDYADLPDLVEEEHPLKQGLKQEMAKNPHSVMTVEEEHPLKQGLKHSFINRR